MLTQVAEERALGGMCGSGCCPRPLNAAKPKGTFKIDSLQQRVYKDGDLHFCRHVPLPDDMNAALFHQMQCMCHNFGS